MNSKRKDLQYASVFLLAVALTFLMGKGDNLWLVSWGDLIPSLFVLFIAGDCLYSYGKVSAHPLVHKIVFHIGPDKGKLLFPG